MSVSMSFQSIKNMQLDWISIQIFLGGESDLFKIF